jgi:carboxylesterase type B
MESFLICQQAYGGRGDQIPFQQAIIESPGLTQTASPIVEEKQVRTFTSWLNATTIQEARKASTTEIIRANYLAIAVADYGSFGYGPSVDGDFVPALPGVLLRNGRFDKSVRLLHFHAANEGYGFASPVIQNDKAFEQFVLESFPGLATSPETLKYITTELYPAIFDGSQALNYTSQYERAAAFMTEAFYTCSVAYLGDALPFNTWSSDFVISPSLHESEAKYTVYDGDYHNASRIDSNSTVLSTEQIAYVVQGYISRFAQFGNPNGDDAPHWPVFGKNATAQIVNTLGFTTGKEASANARCEWWSKGLYY